MHEQLYKVILEYHLKAHKVTKFSKPVYMPESLYNMLRSNLKSGCDVPLPFGWNNSLFSRYVH